MSCEVAFDYLADPLHRAEWQSSLARVEDVVGEPGPGQRWTDVTRPGLRPRMETTGWDRPHRWAESGRWRGVRADLTLTFAPTATGCEVVASFRIQALGPVGWALTALSRPAVRADLRRAAGVLSRRS